MVASPTRMGAQRLRGHGRPGLTLMHVTHFGCFGGNEASSSPHPWLSGSAIITVISLPPRLVFPHLFLPTCSLISLALVLGPLLPSPYGHPRAWRETTIPISRGVRQNILIAKARNCPLGSMLEQSLSQSTHSEILAGRMNKWNNAK